MSQLLLIISVILMFNSCISPDKVDPPSLQINLNTSSTLKLVYTNVVDTIAFNAGFGNFFPADFIEASPLKICGNGVEYLELAIQLPQKIEISLDGFMPENHESGPGEEPENSLEATCFLVPADTLELNIDLSESTEGSPIISYIGKYAHISDYYRTKRAFFDERSLLMEKAILANSTTCLNSFRFAIDSLTQVELQFLDTYLLENELPDWFVDYEINDLKYFAFSIKISEPMLLEFTHGEKPDIPKDYFSFTDGLWGNNMDAILSIYYFLGLRDYYYHCHEPEQLQNSTDSISIEQRLKYYVNYSRSNFNSYVSDIILSREIDFLIGINKMSREEFEILSGGLNDSIFLNYFEARYQNKDLLKPGDQAPYFYLMDDEENYISLNDLRGNVIYVSFWFTGCKPCIKEFPEENKLVETFMGQNVKIVSICLNSDERSWKYLINKHELNSINLFAREHWNAILKEKYDINSFPHYVLIDKEGTIIQNKCGRPGEGAEQLIRTYLDK